MLRESVLDLRCNMLLVFLAPRHWEMIGEEAWKIQEIELLQLPFNDKNGTQLISFISYRLHKTCIYFYEGTFNLIHFYSPETCHYPNTKTQVE